MVKYADAFHESDVSRISGRLKLYFESIVDLHMAPRKTSTWRLRLRTFQAVVAHLIDVEVPTEYYYEAYGKDLLARHPKASAEVHEHMRSLVVFLDTSILH